MRKYLHLIRYEFKTIAKDPMTLFMLFYPLLMLFITGFLVPSILERTSVPSSNGSMITLLIAFVLTLSMGSFLMGALLGFSLLENKDENTLQNIAVTPITVSGYALFKVAYTYVFALIGNFIMVGGLKLIASDKYVIDYMGVTIRLLDRITVGNLVFFSLASSLMVPMIAMVIGAIAKNKVEGFAFMKSSGIIIMIPLLALLNVFQDWKQYLLGVVPLFWPVKAFLNLCLNLSNPADLPFWGYLVVGATYSILLGGISLKFFLKKANLT